MKSKYSIGIDATEISRFNPDDKSFVKKNLVCSEVDFFNTLNSFEKKQKFLASVWALKEAIYKSNNNVSIQKIEISHLSNGQPICINLPKISLSLSYCNNMVIAISLSVK